ncbi:MAG: thioredoxin family protein, partial [Chitinispirillaceae bacterium]
QALLLLLVAGCIDPAVTPDTTGTEKNAAVQLYENTFDSTLSIPGRISMVDFILPTCGACLFMDSTVDSLAVRFKNQALIARVDLSEESALGSEFSIRTVPTFLFFESGTEVRRVIGAVKEDSLASILDSMISESQKGGSVE